MGGVASVSVAVLAHVEKPLQLFFSFCLNLKFVSLFSKSSIDDGSFDAIAAALCILIPAAPNE